MTILDTSLQNEFEFETLRSFVAKCDREFHKCHVTGAVSSQTVVTLSLDNIDRVYI